MKKTMIAILLCVLLLVFTGCGQPTEMEDDGRLDVVATVFPPYDFTRQIAGDTVDLTMLLSPETESHGFEPTLRDIAVIQDCDLFICIGGASEAWVDGLLSKIDTTDITVVRLIDYVEPIVAEGSHDHNDHEHDDHCEHDTAEYDEHIWTSPLNAIKMTEAISRAMCECDPDNARIYLDGCAEFCSELSELDRQLTALTAESVRNTLVFAERFPFLYLAEQYSLEYHAAFSGCSGDTEPSLAVIAQLTALIEQEQIPVVFYIEFSDQTTADTICQATGAKKLLLHSCHNLTQEEFDSGTTYLELMQQNIENLREALN